MILFKLIALALRQVRSSLLTLFYKALPGVFFKKLGWGCVLYGPIGIGSVGNANISVGRGCVFGKHVYLSAARQAEIVVGPSVSINTGCHIVAVYGVEIGEGTAIAEYVSIRDQNHDFSSPEKGLAVSGYTGAPIRIGKGVWLGRGVFVGPGVTIGDHCVVGANSVVTRSLPARSVAVGSPAVVIRMIEAGVPEVAPS